MEHFCRKPSLSKHLGQERECLEDTWHVLVGLEQGEGASSSPLRKRYTRSPFLALLWALEMQMSPTQAWALPDRTSKVSGRGT